MERPVSVVKEMVENSLDAKSTKVKVEIGNGGRTYIKITDNGCGIPKDELELALTRYATSKISSIDDLDTIGSFGFRGEALASITAVSRLTLISKTAEQEHAWQIHAEGALDEPLIKPSAYPNGTTILVEDLFFNTPARRRFLKSDKTEFAHIQDLIAKLSLSNPSVSFLLKHNDKVVYNLPSASSQEQITKRFTQILGGEFTDRMLTVSECRENISIEGYVLPAPDETDSTPEVQFMFLNGRIVKEKNVFHAVKQAYTEVYAREVKCSFVLFISINPQDVDVNVHPTKHEVRFREARFVHDFVVLAVTEALSKVEPVKLKVENEHFYASHNDLVQNEPQTADSSDVVHENDNVASLNDFSYGGNKYAGSSGASGSRSSCSGSWSGSGFSGGRSYDRNRDNYDRKQYDAYNSWMSSAFNDSNNSDGQVEKSDPAAVENLSQSEHFEFYGIYKSYACVGFNQKLYRIDLRKIDERELLNQLSDGDAKSSLLMLPLEIPLEKNDVLNVENNIKFLEERGFKIQSNLKNKPSVKIMGVPAAIRRFNLSQLLTALFTTHGWYEEDDKFNLILVSSVLNCKKYTLVEAVQMLSNMDPEKFCEDPSVASAVDLSVLLAE